MITVDHREIQIYEVLYSIPNGNTQSEIGKRKGVGKKSGVCSGISVTTCNPQPSIDRYHFFKIILITKKMNKK
jgi:hypothetical protein